MQKFLEQKVALEREKFKKATYRVDRVFQCACALYPVWHYWKVVALKQVQRSGRLGVRGCMFFKAIMGPQSHLLSLLGLLVPSQAVLSHHVLPLGCVASPQTPQLLKTQWNSATKDTMEPPKLSLGTALLTR